MEMSIYNDGMILFTSSINLTKQGSCGQKIIYKNLFQ